MTADLIRQMQVVHRLKDSSGGGMPGNLQQRLQQTGLFIDTCQRQLSVSLQAPEGMAEDPAASLFQGGAAYTLLLQTMTGLNSSVQGETNVQGQFRRQWKSWQSEADANVARVLSPIMRALLEDSRLIRARYLHGIGGHSYGSLVRKLIAAPSDARIVFVGCGELALSMLDLFSDWQTGLWNRHTIVRQPAYAGRLFAPEEQAEAAAWATHLVFTTPPDENHDRQWLQRLHQDVVAIVHLGRRRADPGPWNGPPLSHQSAPEFHDLDDIFELQQRQSALRSVRLLQARYACSLRTNEHLFSSASTALESAKTAIATFQQA